MVRLAATARTTGRGAFRNWRQRMPAQERVDDVPRRSCLGHPPLIDVTVAKDRQRPARRDRLGAVGGEQLDRTGKPLELLLRGEETDADPDRIEAHDRPGDREHPGAELFERGLGGPAGDPERQQRPHPVDAA